MNCYEFLVDDPAYVCVIIYNCPHKIKKKARVYYCGAPIKRQLVLLLRLY